MADYCNGEEPKVASSNLTLAIQKIIRFNEPINARLRSILYQPTVCDEISACMEEVVEISLGASALTDTELLYDDDNLYDLGDTSTLLTTITQRCGTCGEFDTTEYSDDFTNNECN